MTWVSSFNSLRLSFIFNAVACHEKLVGEGGGGVGHKGISQHVITKTFEFFLFNFFFWGGDYLWGALASSAPMGATAMIFMIQHP